MADKLIIDKLFLLETQLRKFYEYKILEPFVFNPKDAHEVQSAAKKIASHLKLENMTFIISYAKQGENTGGHIQLDNSNDVFIEIDSEIKYDCEAVLSVLAHEICHKYLYKHNIKLYPEFENEILTDTATIFTGLGKLTLNGCEKTHVTTTNNLDGSRTERTNTRKLGYLDKSQFAFIYKICSTIHRVDKKDIFSNLSLNAKSEIQKIQQRVDLYLNEKFFNRNFYFHAFKTDFKESQTNVAIFQRNVLTIEHGILPHCLKIIEQYNQIIYSKFNPIIEKLKFLEDESSTTYITNLAISHEYDNFKKDVIEFENSLKKIIKTVDKFSQFIENNSSDISNTLTSESSFLNIFHCPYCKKEMRISTKKLARVSCSHCNHNFIIDTGHKREITNNKDKNKTGILGWFKAIFKK